MLTIKVSEKTKTITHIMNTPWKTMHHVIKVLGEVARGDQELFWVIPANAQHKLCEPILIAMGGSASCHVDKAILFRRALMAGACGIFLVHNHPGGTPEFSPEDINLTKEIKAGCATIGLTLLDHFVLFENDGNVNAASMYMQGLI